MVVVCSCCICVFLSFLACCCVLRLRTGQQTAAARTPHTARTVQQAATTRTPSCPHSNTPLAPLHTPPHALLRVRCVCARLLSSLHSQCSAQHAACTSHAQESAATRAQACYGPRGHCCMCRSPVHTAGVMRACRVSGCARSHTHRERRTQQQQRSTARAGHAAGGGSSGNERACELGGVCQVWVCIVCRLSNWLVTFAACCSRECQIPTD